MLVQEGALCEGLKALAAKLDVSGGESFVNDPTLSNLKHCIDKDIFLSILHKLEQLLKSCVLWESLVVVVEEAAKHADKSVHIVGGNNSRWYSRVEMVEGVVPKVDSVEADNALFNNGSEHCGVLDKNEVVLGALHLDGTQLCQGGNFTVGKHVLSM